MEALGIAVGVASLGIQVCQGLLSYYDSWKDYGSDIRRTYQAITDLSRTLTLLQDLLEQGVDEERAVRVGTCLKSCEDTLLDLEKKRHSLQEYSTPEGTREKLRSTLQKSWYPLRKETLGKVEANVVDARERLELALQVLQLDVTLELRRQSTAQHASLAQLSAQNQRLLDTHQSEEFQKIVAWLSAADPWTNHNSARQRHESQTGDWLLQSDQYHKWKLEKGSRLLMYGKPGCGKTVLCSTAISNIREHCQQNPGTAYACFYFSFSDERKQCDWDLLRSLVTQLGWREPGLSMLRQAFDGAKRSVPGPDELERILLASMRSCDRVFLLIDALDECPEEDDVRQGVLKQVERLVQNAPNINIFATSRELHNIRESMEELKFGSLRITPSTVNADIQVYVSNQLSRDRNFRKFGSATLGLIESTIAKKADGMFRWAYCQLQELKKLKSTAPKYVKIALNALPTTLDDTYARMLIGIEEMYRAQALLLLQWLAYARSPPTLGELVEAAIINPSEESTIDVENRGGVEDTLNILSGLVTIDMRQEATAQDDLAIESPTSDISSTKSNHADYSHYRQRISSTTRIRFAHFSVKEYLESRRILKSNASCFYLEDTTGHRTLAQSCLIYLRYYSASSEKTSTDRDLDTFALLKYAAQSWFRHSKLQGSCDFCHEAALLQSEKARQDWLVVYDPDMTWRAAFENPSYRLLAPFGSGLYYASGCGLHKLVERLLDENTDVNAQGGDYGNALYAASSHGYTDVVQLLLDKNADVNAQGGHYGNALQAASSHGYTEVVQLLLNKNADVNAQGGHYGNALQAASSHGHAAVVQLLLSRAQSLQKWD